jgi:hypothetical protein
MNAQTLIQWALSGSQARAIEDGIGQRFLGIVKDCRQWGVSGY